MRALAEILGTHCGQRGGQLSLEEERPSARERGRGLPSMPGTQCISYAARPHLLLWLGCGSPTKVHVLEAWSPVWQHQDGGTWWRVVWSLKTPPSSGTVWCSDQLPQEGAVAERASPALGGCGHGFLPCSVGILQAWPSHPPRGPHGRKLNRGTTGSWTFSPQYRALNKLLFFMKYPASGILLQQQGTN